MSVPSSAAVHAHLQSRTVSYSIIHLEHHVEMQDTEVVETVKMITNLKKQLLQLQGPAPPAPVDHEEIDVMSGIDED
jgi:hypothetical protein